MYKVLGAENCFGGDAAASAAANQKFPSKNLSSSFSKSFTYSGKQGDGATVLGEGRDIVTREICIPTFMKVNTLGKAAVLHFALFCCWSLPNSACTAMLMSSSHRLLIIHSPHPHFQGSPLLMYREVLPIFHGHKVCV
jgi:hypothetical protein